MLLLHKTLLCIMRFRRTFFILIFSSIVFFAFIAFFLDWSNVDPRLCFIFPDSLEQSALASETNANNYKLLEDVLTAAPKPTPGKSIFFHETSCRWLKQSQESTSFFNVNQKPALFNTVDLSARQACAIESAALHHANSSIFVLFASPTYQWTTSDAEHGSGASNKSNNAILQAILSYPNIYLRNLNIFDYASQTPLQEFLDSGKLFESKYVLSHVSDFLRYLTLWRFGGTYLDMDVIVLRNLDDLPPNYTGAESYEDLAAGVMNFAPTDYGHKIAEACLTDFKHNFKGYDWGNNGPGVITRTFLNLCNAKNVRQLLEQGRCSNFHVYEPSAFYAVPWRQWRAFFDARNSTETLKRTEQSFVIHVWNKHSSKWPLNKNSTAAYAMLARKHCPKVFASLSDYF